MSAGALAIEGERVQGQDVRTQNVMACVALANIVKSSLGPVGLDKMLVDNIGDVTITNDGATILKQLEVEHPAARVMVDLAELQDSKVGDGTTSVVILAAELLKRANDLVRMHVHPTTIMAGYTLAKDQAKEYMVSKLKVSLEDNRDAMAMAAARTSMASKVLGPNSEFFGRIVVDAVSAIKRVDADGAAKYPISSINIVKAHGQSARESQFVNGIVLNGVRCSAAMPKTITGAKIALLDFNLQRHRMALGIQVLVTDPSKLERIRQQEAEITKAKIQMIIEKGANVILTTKGIDDLCQKYLVEAGVIGVRRCTKADLNRIAAATGATLLPSLANPEDEHGGEIFREEYLGSAGEVSEERVGDGSCLFIRSCATTNACSILLRGANELLLDEMDRALHDSLCVVQRVLQSKAVVAGGGAVETALYTYLNDFASKLATKEQLAVKEFAEALLVIPKTLAINAALDATELVTRLCSVHNEVHIRGADDPRRFCGLDLVAGKIVNNMEAGVVEPLGSKVKSLRYATEAAISILRIDDFIKIAPPRGPPR